MSDKKSFLLDGRKIQFQPGQSILEAALADDQYIPHLCFHPAVSPHGSCRLCLVKSDGRFVPACTTEVHAGMQLENDTEELNALRLTLVEMLFAEGNHFCPSCELSGNCQLQALAYALGMTHSDYPLQYPTRSRDGSHADIYLDRDRCVNCELCVRASRELDQKNVFSFGGRGAGAYLQVNSGQNNVDQQQLKDTDIISSDNAARICPVGTIVHKRGVYSERSNARLYDKISIKEIGNQRPSVVNGGNNPIK